MANLIVETHIVTASNLDLLKAPSRLAAIPEDGTLTLEMSSDVCNETNNMKVTVRTADGDVPIKQCTIPANGYSTASAVLHGSTEWVVTLPVRQGQHVVIELEEAGTATAYVRATLS